MAQAVHKILQRCQINASWQEEMPTARGASRHSPSSHRSHIKILPQREQDLTSGTWFVCNSLTEKEPQFKKFSQYFVSEKLYLTRFKLQGPRQAGCAGWALSGSCCWDSHHTTSFPALSSACSQLSFPGFGAPGSAAGH